LTRHLVTGGAGFVGSHLVDALLARGDDVIVLDDLSTGSRANLVPHKALRIVEGRVDDVAVVEESVAAADTCFHLAASVGVELIVDNPLGALLNNVHGCDTVLAAAARHGRRLVYASTSEVYGRNPRMPLHESSDRVLGPADAQRWSYAIAKAFGEAALLGYVSQQNADMVAVRLFNTVGPRQSPAYGMVLPRFVRQALAGQPLTVYGTGHQRRCFTHVADTVDALVRVMDEPETRGRVFNVGSTVPVSVIELAERVIAATGGVGELRLVPYERVFGTGFEEPAMRLPDTAALREATGWETRRTLDDAIRDVVGDGSSQIKLAA
jgi:UDP-glucose 4-epimerase